MGGNSLRIVYNNIADNAALSAPSVGDLTVDNLKKSYKNLVWRTSNLSAKITADDFPAQPVSFVGLLYNNLSVSSLIRVKGYYQSQLRFDTGWLMSNPPDFFDDLDWGVEPLGVNYYSRVVPTSVRQKNIIHSPIWLDNIYVIDQLEVEIEDVDNEQQHIEAGNLLVGLHWAPEITADRGLQVVTEDNTVQSRTESGSLRSYQLPSHKQINFQLSSLSLSEGEKLNSIISSSGKTHPVFVSIYPQSDSHSLECHYQIYGKLSRSSPVNTPFYNTNQTMLYVEEI